ncbi:MAG: SDR family NAD(P)-dependent oxidoreductase [Acidobacteriota bacterium]
MSLDFQDRPVVVTGGTGALGRAVVGRLLDAGARCLVTCWQEDELQDFPYTDHPRVDVRSGIDLTDESTVVDLYGGLEAALGSTPLWASIHCAGGFDMSPFTETALDAYRRQMAMNADSCFLCCREAAKAMRHGDGGRIVNVAARPALEPRSGGAMVAYTVSKAAVVAMTAAAGEALAADGIWVNAVAPSIIDTPANREAMPDANPTPWPSTKDLAETIVFLASPENRSTRSATVPVYGRA